MNQKLLFLHIWKAAGTSLHDYLGKARPGYRIVSGENRVSADAWLAHATGVGGHFLFEHVSASLSRPDVLSITVIREPCQRVLSHFFFNRDHLDQSLNVAKSVPFRESLLRVLERGKAEQFSLLSNTQVAVLAGAARSSEDPEERLGAAAAHLRQFSLVGQTERLDSLCARVASRLGFPDSHPLMRLNSRHNPISPSDISEDLLALLRQANELDSRLWKIAGEISEVVGVTPALSKAQNWTRFGNRDATILSLFINSKPAEDLLELEVHIQVSRPGNYTLGFRFIDELGATLFGTTLAVLNVPLKSSMGNQQVQIDCDFGIVAPGLYTLDLSLNDEWSVCDAWNDAGQVHWQKVPKVLQVGRVVIEAHARLL